MVDLFLPLQEPFRLIQAFFIIAGLWLDARLFWMLIYEIKCYNGAGEDYWQYGKEYVKEKVNQKQ